MEKKDEMPGISVLTYTYNARETIEECITSFFSQDYPFDKIEWIIVDGGSKDNTLELIKSYQKKYPKIIKFYESPTEHSCAGNVGHSQFARRVSKELVLFIDQGDILVNKDWLKKMAGILKRHEKISAVQSRIAISKRDNFINKYLSAIGIDDPFAVPYSLNSQVTIHPRIFRYDSDCQMYVYKVNKNNFLYGGGGGFMIKKEDFFNCGGWIQDTDLFYRMGLHEYYVAVPKYIQIYKKKSSGIKKFLKQRGEHIDYYLKENYYGRDFYWFDLRKNIIPENFKFIKTVIFNLLIIPGLIQGIRMAVRQKRIFWIIHPIALFSITIYYMIIKLVSFFDRQYS